MIIWYSIICEHIINIDRFLENTISNTISDLEVKNANINLSKNCYVKEIRW